MSKKQSTKHQGMEAERWATYLLEGEATLSGTQEFDVWWKDQGRRVEVKRVNAKSNDVRKKRLHADLRRNWDKFDYCMLMVYINDLFDHCYLIPAADLTNRIPSSKSITIPTNWDNFSLRNRLYAMRTDNGIARLH